MKPQPAKPGPDPKMTELYRDAAARLRKLKKPGRTKTEIPKAAPDPQRLVHELQVHQIELEMQNSELLEARDRIEELLAKYTDLYDFAPVGYLSLDEQGQVQEVNLSGAELLGVDRARLINRRLPALVSPPDRGIFLAFLKRVFADGGRQVCEATLLREGGTSFRADIQGVVAISASSPKKWCRVVVSDVTELKRAEEAQRRAEETEAVNTEQRREIARRSASEASLRQSEQHQREMLDQSREMQEQLRRLSRKVFTAQEDERKRISRELHDVIAQTLTNINLRLAILSQAATLNPKDLAQSIDRTQKLMAHSVDMVHRFARELRPPALDDLGLIPALQSLLKNFTVETGIHSRLSAFAGLEQVNDEKRTVLYRVAQEALTNVARHAEASRAEVRILKRDGFIYLEIIDNGKGFPTERELQPKRNRRLGLLGMKERAQMVNGNLTVRSTPGKGTTIRVQIPLAKARAAGD